MNGLIHSRKFVWKLILFAYFLLGKQQTNNVISIFLKRNSLYCRFPFPFSKHPLINQVKKITWTFHTFSSYNHFESPFSGAVHQKERKAKNEYLLCFTIFFSFFSSILLAKMVSEKVFRVVKTSLLAFCQKKGTFCLYNLWTSS